MPDQQSQDEPATVRLAVDVTPDIAGRLQELAQQAAIERKLGRVNRMDTLRALITFALEDDEIRAKVIAGVPAPPPRKRRTAEELRQAEAE